MTDGEEVRGDDLVHVRWGFGQWLRFAIYRRFLFGPRSLHRRVVAYRQLSECKRRAAELGYAAADVTVVTTQSQLASILKGSKKPRLVVLAMTHDDDVVEALACLKEAGTPVLLPKGPRLGHPVSRYHERSAGRLACLTQAARRGLRHFDSLDADCMLQALDATQALTGPVVEIGVFEGNSAHLILDYLQKAGGNSPVVLIDTFGGFDFAEARESIDARWTGTHRLADVENRISALQERGARVIRGNAIHVDLDGITDIRLLHVDVDLYESTLGVLQRLWPQMALRGLALCEDVGHMPICAGARLAVQDFLRTLPATSYFSWYDFSGTQIILKIA